MDWEVWLLEGGREHSFPVRADDEEEAASAFCDDRGFDSTTHEVDVCVAEIGSDQIKTFTVKAEYDRRWIAIEWPSPLERFGEAISRVARYIDDMPRREAAQAELDSWHEERARRDARRDALAALRALGEAVATVARARLVSSVADGGWVRWESADGERMLELWQSHGGLCISEYSAAHVQGRRLHTLEGDPEDIAAEAVARLIEEVGRE